MFGHQEYLHSEESAFLEQTGLQTTELFDTGEGVGRG